jgi:hypothetical protein
MVGLAPEAVPRVREEIKTKAAGSSTPITIREPVHLHDRRREVADLVTRRNRTCGLHPGLASKMTLRCVLSFAVIMPAISRCRNSLYIRSSSRRLETLVSHKRKEVSSNKCADGGPCLREGLRDHTS